MNLIYQEQFQERMQNYISCLYSFADVSGKTVKLLYMLFDRGNKVEVKGLSLKVKLAVFRNSQSNLGESKLTLGTESHGKQSAIPCLFTTLFGMFGLAKQERI